jgi:hypothetical protein
VHERVRTPLPALADLVDLLDARGAHPTIELQERPARRYQSRDEVLTFLRRQTWVSPGSRLDQRLQDQLDATAVVGEGGFLVLADSPARFGIVRWTPGFANHP